MKYIGGSINLFVSLLMLAACTASTTPVLPTDLLSTPTSEIASTAISVPIPETPALSLIPVELLQMEGARGWQLPEAEIWQAVYSPNGDYLAIIGSLGLSIYETSTMELRAAMHGEGEIHTVDWSPDGRQLATGFKDGTLEVWDWEIEKKLVNITASPYWIANMMWSIDGKWLANATGGSMQVWDVFADTEKFIFSNDKTYSLAWSPDGSRLAGGGLNATVRVWDTATWKKLVDLHGTGRHESQSFWTVTTLSWSPDGYWLAGGLEEGSILIWDQTTGSVFATLPLEQTQMINSLAWSPDGKWLASGASDWIGRVWDVSTGEELITFNELGKVASITWSPDGKHLAIGTMEGLLIIWDVSQLPL